MKAIAMLTIVISIVGLTSDTLTGRWESKPSKAGNVTSVLFKKDNSFEGYINRKPFTTGRYIFQDSIFSFTDNGCGGAKGVYKIIFFSNEDSLRFEPVSDSCLERREGMKRLVLGKIKQ